MHYLIMYETQPPALHSIIATGGARNRNDKQSPSSRLEETCDRNWQARLVISTGGSLRPQWRDLFPPVLAPPAIGSEIPPLRATRSGRNDRLLCATRFGRNDRAFARYALRSK